MFLDETMAVVPQLERAYAADRPGLIVYDIAAFPGLVLAEKWQVPCIQLSPAHVYFEGIEETLGIEPSPESSAVHASYDEYFARQGVEVTFQDMGKPRWGIVTIPRTFHYGERVSDAFDFVGPMLTRPCVPGGLAGPGFPSGAGDLAWLGLQPPIGVLPQMPPGVR
ncbi:hypothetical protein ACWDKQ_33955 [Saccharopolyspora sp. NPDC000995]